MCFLFFSLELFGKSDSSQGNVFFYDFHQTIKVPFKYVMMSPFSQSVFTWMELSQINHHNTSGASFPTLSL